MSFEVLFYTVTPLFGYLIDFFKGLLTPIIGGVTVYIACQQWKTNHLRLKLETYDRRIRVYEQVKDILRSLNNNPQSDMANLVTFSQSVSQADFLFGREISEYIEEIVRHGASLCRWQAEYRDYTQQPFPPGYDHNKVLHGMQKELNWLVEQLDRAKGKAKAKFKKYLELSKN